MNDVYPFTPAFGLAHNRPACVESAGQLFDKLAGPSPAAGELLPFGTLARICFDYDGTLQRDKVKALIKLFRPSRKGYLTKLDFVSSVDEVYKGKGADMTNATLCAS